MKVRSAVPFAAVPRLFRFSQTNIYGTFFLTRAAVPHMPKGSSIIVTASQVAYAGPRAFISPRFSSSANHS